MNLRRSAVTSLLAAGALALAACGSSGGAGGGKPSRPPSSAAASAAPSAAKTSLGNYHPVTDYTAYIGGHKGAADSSLSPIDVGIINQQGGSADIAPEWTNGAQIAADFINKDAGGIDGHPIKLVSCFIPDVVANAAQCGRQMANDSKVAAVTLGPVAVGNQAMESALAPTGKVLVFGVAVSPVDTTYKHGYILFGDGTHVEAPLATFIKKYLHSKSVAIIYPNLPGSATVAKITKAALQYEHIPTKIVGFDPSTTSLSGPVIASGAATAGLVINDSPAPQICSNIYKALKQLNVTTPVLANVPCDSKQAAIGDGGHLPIGWYYASANPLPGDPADPSMPAFAKVADQFGNSKYDQDVWTANAFAQVLTIAKWDGMLLKAGKKITAANMNQVASTFKGPVPQGPPTLVCGHFPKAPAVCNDKDSFFQNTAPGVFKAIVRFIGPPAGFTIPKGLQ